MRFSRRRIALLGLMLPLATAWVPAAHARTLATRPVRVPVMVARALPSVVSITTRRIEQDQFNKPVPKAGMGSGVIVDPRGYILTNNHVVEGFEEIKATLPDGRAFRATFVGGDRFTDLAVVKIEGKNLRALSLGDSSRLVVGEPVIAIGSPLWIEGGPSVTMGVISGMGRSMEEPDDPEQPMLHNLLQTDAAINPGNSGGPLLNLAGQVVGINTALIPTAHGIGFAIAINNARPIMKMLLNGGRIVRPSLGVVAVSVTPQLAFANDLQVERGALVVRVESGGPAQDAGIQPNDVIVGFKGQAIGDLHEFHASLARCKPGETVEVTVWRDGQILQLVTRLREEA